MPLPNSSTGGSLTIKQPPSSPVTNSSKQLNQQSTMKTKNQIIEALVAALEIPPNAYDKAHDRYKDLGEWFCESSLKDNKPRIYAQGSFRLGTVTRPLNEEEFYDLDVGC